MDDFYAARRGLIPPPPWPIFSPPFSTLIAAETTGRACLGVELNPAYVDVAVARWQRFTGGAAVLDSDGRTFDEIASGRAEAA